ncbi:MAG TPA: hypothetical protein DCP32_13380 [Anaerolineaceae bacterium]|nr:MAG: hypothetical protein A2X24_10425 [Chloroflexi bacterium GWB2_54_36]HAL17688.1 hypothetical protein [Anaerolineaceae bacterium]HBA90431.1 hypothetical protein [Anaerolineaceae bacterium]
MAIVSETQKTQTVSGHRWVTLGLILALLILRYLVTASQMAFSSVSWVAPTYEVGTYLLTAILLIWESHSLPDYHITNFVIWLVILFKPLETIYLSNLARLNSPLAFPKIPGLLIWLIALGLLWHFRTRLFTKGAVQKQDLRWVLLGALGGLVAVLIIAYPMSFQVSPPDPRGKYSVLSVLINGLKTIPYQIGYAAVSEEPVFRGFLWGYLRKNGWRDVWIWLFQAGLFSLAHLYYINTAPISFWFIVPLLALVQGWLVWRSRSIATSMVAHGVANGLGYTMGYLVAIFRL